MVEHEDHTFHTINTPLLVEMQQVSFGYRRQTLLYEVSMSVRATEMVGLLGPNGSGKTTLLRLLSGVLQPQQGHVFLQGCDLRQWGRRGAAQHIAVVPQEMHMPFDFTVEHMVGLGRTPFVTSFWQTRRRQDAELVGDAMEAAGVFSLAERIFNELSGGERQRVMIAMALAQQPAVLLLDEPTAHLDIKYQIETLELVQKLNRERGMTIIAALHDLNLAARYFPRLLLFQRGIVADASPTEVLEPGLLRRVYGINVQVGILRGAEHLSVLPPSHDADHAQDGPPPLVHVIAGGGSGELMMRALADAHIPFSAGALNIGDSDHTLALRLAKEVITEQPYSPVSRSALAKVDACLLSVKLLIICPTAIGPGNLALLQEAVHAAKKGLPVVLLASSVDTACAPNDTTTEIADDLQLPDMAARDYTQGQGLALLKQLVRSGALVATTVNEVLEEVRKHQEKAAVS
ncbi:MAG: ABC transporter ATP-binding protein [Ktedonobacteraceae bacterium]|nr:ABC transporter ATP-binding protein [Ktedonobacteraceae bacterium]